VNTGELSTEVGSWLVEGIGEDFIPPICDLSRVQHAYTIPDAEAFTTCREVLRQEGLLVGTSSGTLIAAALRYCREQTRPKRVVTFVCDSGNKYLSKVYNDYWMLDQGFIQRETYGDLRDLIARRHQDRATVTVAPDDTVLTAYNRMKLYEISQLPVVDHNRIVGLVDEEDLLLDVFNNESRFRDPVSQIMTRALQTISPTASLETLLPIFDRGMVAIIKEGDEFWGIITRIDLLNYLRRRMK
jgi:cystathionine beta-synthase